MTFGCSQFAWCVLPEGTGDPKFNLPLVCRFLITWHSEQFGDIKRPVNKIILSRVRKQRADSNPHFCCRRRRCCVCGASGTNKAVRKDSGEEKEPLWPRHTTLSHAPRRQTGTPRDPLQPLLWPRLPSVSHTGASFTFRLCFSQTKGVC